MEIKKLSEKELYNAVSLVWSVFDEFEAVNYSERGKEAFWNTIHSEHFLNMLTAYGAFDCGKLIGMIATRNQGAHIALFFVDGRYQRKGIGKRLFSECLIGNENACITVNSSVFAVDVYRKLGFVEVGERMEDNGIIFTSMAYKNKR